MLDRVKNWIHKGKFPVKTRQGSQAIVAALVPRTQNLGPCPSCGSISRGAAPRLYDMVERTLDPEAERLTVAAVLCRQCGHVHFFEASSLGLLE